MRILFTDTNPNVIKELHTKFAAVDDEKLSFRFHIGSIFDLDDTIDVYVTAGNSYGIMTGGIDLAFRNKFGYELQDRIQEELFFYRRQKLAVGEAINVYLPNTNKRLIYAPTMIIPSDVSKTQNARYAFLATLREAKRIQGQILNSIIIACPGFCTLSGKMTSSQAADQMFQALKDYKIGESFSNDANI